MVKLITFDEYHKIHIIQLLCLCNIPRCLGKKKVSNVKEMVQSDPQSRPPSQNGKKPKLQIDMIQRDIRLQNLYFKTANNVHWCVGLIKSICISQVSQCEFRSIWSFYQNRHAIYLYFEICNSQYEILCIYTLQVYFLFLTLPANYPS